MDSFCIKEVHRVGVDCLGPEASSVELTRIGKINDAERTMLKSPATNADNLTSHRTFNRHLLLL